MADPRVITVEEIDPLDGSIFFYDAWRFHRDIDSGALFYVGGEPLIDPVLVYSATIVPEVKDE